MRVAVSYRKRGAKVANIAIIYYSATGNVYELAGAVEEGAREAGAETRLRKVPELAPEEAIRSREAWAQHRDATQHVPEATLDDLAWADGFAFGTPTRYGNPAAQLKQFIDATGPLWQEGKLGDKVVAGFTSTTTPHGGQESTLLALYNVFMHWGCVLVPPGYTHPNQFVVGNPYGVSHVDEQGQKRPSPETLTAARYLGERIATFAQRLAPIPTEAGERAVR
jgi:NAD(P)H dehydrogenase (quinone)